jgi:hypothetical protein
MAWDNDLATHVQSGDRFSQFYFRIPEAWVAFSDEDLQKHVFAVARQMYADLNAGFRTAEPNDISYMLVKSTEAMKLDPAQADAIKPWISAPNPAAWEPTPCVVVHADGSYEKVTREAF